jgi:hypothetical protein
MPRTLIVRGLEKYQINSCFFPCDLFRYIVYSIGHHHILLDMMIDQQLFPNY